MSRPSYFHLVVVAAGWVLTQGTHAITETLVVTGVSGVMHHEAFHRFFSRASWDADDLGHALFRQLRPLTDGVRVVLDDTLAAIWICCGTTRTLRKPCPHGSWPHQTG